MSHVRAGDAIRRERRRQVEAEGYTPEHDREHSVAELLVAGDAYRQNDPQGWPWDGGFKPSSHARNLVKAGALYLAAADLAERLADSRLQEAALGRAIDAQRQLAEEIYTIEALLRG